MRVGVHVGIPCVCGRTDCVETIASGSGIDRCARLLRDRYETRLTFPPEGEKRVSVEEVVNLSQAGDPLCSVLVTNAAEGIANLIMNMVRVTDPDTVVLGGSIVANEYIFERIQAYLNANTMRFVTHGVVLTKLNPQFIGLLGAAAVAMNK